MKKVCALLIFAGLCAAVFLSTPASSQGRKDKLRKNANKIENSYIVVLDDDADRREGYLLNRAVYRFRTARIHTMEDFKHVYQYALNGFAVEMSEKEAERLSQDFRVKFVEEDIVCNTLTRRKITHPGVSIASTNGTGDQMPSTHSTGPGLGVRAYVIDTGIRTDHTQFGGRASNVFDAFGGNGQDCNGHGTHVAGTIDIDVRRRKERVASWRASAQLLRLRLELGRDRGCRLGTRKSHRAGSCEHESWWRNIECARYGSEQPSQC